MRTIYTGDEIRLGSARSLFLAGPTPRVGKIATWRQDALAILGDLGYEGVVLVPEFDDGIHREDTSQFLQWDQKALAAADTVVFWVPRRLPHQPGLTTNLEFGYEISRRPERVWYGRPDDADAILALDLLYQRACGRQPATSLRSLLEGAAALPAARPTIHGYQGEALDYARLSAVPRLSTQKPDAVSLHTQLTCKIAGPLPLIPSPMDTVISLDLAAAVVRAGGIAILVGEGVSELAASIATLDIESEMRSHIFVLIRPSQAWEEISRLVDAGIGGVALDTLHYDPHLHLRAIHALRRYPLEIISGNVVHGDDARRLVEAGVDAVRVGMSAASINRGRELLGCGRSQAASVLDCATSIAGSGVPIIADGGIRSIGDALLALALGACSVMAGRLFASLPESAATTVPGPDGAPHKLYRGMSRAGKVGRGFIAEAAEDLLPVEQPFVHKYKQWQKALRIGISRCGFASLASFIGHAELEQSTR